MTGSLPVASTPVVHAYACQHPVVLYHVKRHAATRNLSSMQVLQRPLRHRALLVASP